VALFGLEGELTVKDKRYQSVMPPCAHLSDGEIAAVVNYVRGAWGNDRLRPAGLAPLAAAAVAALRLKDMTAGQVFAARRRLKPAAK